MTARQNIASRIEQILYELSISSEHHEPLEKPLMRDSLPKVEPKKVENSLFNLESSSAMILLNSLRAQLHLGEDKTQNDTPGNLPHETPGKVIL